MSDDNDDDEIDDEGEDKPSTAAKKSKSAKLDQQYVALKNIILEYIYPYFIY